MHYDNYIMGIGGFFVAMNVVAFGMMLWDKSRSQKKGAARISEGMLFFMATIFGSVGVLLGMFAWRHKTQKWYFVAGIPFLIVQNIALLFVVYLFVSGNISRML